MKDAVIYARYSSDKQDEASIDAQVRACRGVSTLLPEPWAAVWNCAGAHHGRFTPPRFSPSCPHCVILRSRAVAGQEYHCVLTGSLRNSLPGLFLSGWGPLGTLFGRLL